MIKIGINGFGRIGRLVTRAILENPKKAELVAINNPELSLDYIIYLLKYDSVHGMMRNHTFEKSGNDLVINGNKVKVTNEKDPAKLRWDDVKTDVLMECSGKFLTTESAKVFVDNGAKKVIITTATKAPINEDVKAVVSASPARPCCAMG